MNKIRTNPNVGLKMLFQILTQLSLSTVHFLIAIFKPTFWFVHIWPKCGLKQPSIF